MGERHNHADDLDLLGDAHHAVGDRDAARHAWRQALGILDQLGIVRADADKINAKLRHLDAPNSSNAPKQ